MKNHDQVLDSSENNYISYNLFLISITLGLGYVIYYLELLRIYFPINTDNSLHSITEVNQCLFLLAKCMQKLLTPTAYIGLLLYASKNTLSKEVLLPSLFAPLSLPVVHADDEADRSTVIRCMLDKSPFQTLNGKLENVTASENSKALDKFKQKFRLKLSNEGIDIDANEQEVFPLGDDKFLFKWVEIELIPDTNHAKYRIMASVFTSDNRMLHPKTELTYHVSMGRIHYYNYKVNVEAIRQYCYGAPRIYTTWIDSFQNYQLTAHEITNNYTLQRFLHNITVNSDTVADWYYYYDQRDKSFDPLSSRVGFDVSPAIEVSDNIDVDDFKIAVYWIAIYPDKQEKYQTDNIVMRLLNKNGVFYSDKEINLLTYNRPEQPEEFASIFSNRESIQTYFSSFLNETLFSNLTEPADVFRNHYELVDFFDSYNDRRFSPENKFLAADFKLVHLECKNTSEATEAGKYLQVGNNCNLQTSLFVFTKDMGVQKVTGRYASSLNCQIKKVINPMHITFTASNHLIGSDSDDGITFSKRETLMQFSGTVSDTVTGHIGHIITTSSHIGCIFFLIHDKPLEDKPHTTVLGIEPPFANSPRWVTIFQLPGISSNYENYYTKTIISDDRGFAKLIGGTLGNTMDVSNLLTLSERYTAKPFLRPVITAAKIKIGASYKSGIVVVWNNKEPLVDNYYFHTIPTQLSILHNSTEIAYVAGDTINLGKIIGIGAVYNPSNIQLTLTVDSSDVGGISASEHFQNVEQSHYNPTTGEWLISGSLEQVNKVLDHTKLITNEYCIPNSTLEVIVEDDIGSNRVLFDLVCRLINHIPFLIQSRLDLSESIDTDLIPIDSNAITVRDEDGDQVQIYSNCENANFLRNSNGISNFFQSELESSDGQIYFTVQDRLKPVRCQVVLSDYAQNDELRQKRKSQSQAYALEIIVNQLPYLTNSAIELNKKTNVTISGTALQANDADSDQGDIEFYIQTQFCFFLKDKLRVNHFKQADIEKGEISIKRTDVTKAPECLVQLSDDNGITRTPLQSVDLWVNQLPILLRAHIDLINGDDDSVQIKVPEHISVTDDESIENIQFFAHTKYCNFEINGISTKLFTMQDIRAGRVWFHRDPETDIEPSCQLQLSDDGLLYSSKYDVSISHAYRPSNQQKATLNQQQALNDLTIILAVITGLGFVISIGSIIYDYRKYQRSRVNEERRHQQSLQAARVNNILTLWTAETFPFRGDDREKQTYREKGVKEMYAIEEDVTDTNPPPIQPLDIHPFFSREGLRRRFFSKPHSKNNDIPLTSVVTSSSINSVVSDTSDDSTPDASISSTTSSFHSAGS